MAILVRDLLDLPGLGLNVVAGADGLDARIRWAHISELQDPTPWLSGGELLLTTGMGLQGSPALQRAYIRRLVKAGLAGLGFGVGFSFDAVPSAIVKTGDREGFPVLEVPYPVPFIAITEAISSRLSEERVRDAQMSVEVHERLAALVSSGAGPADVLDEVGALVRGWSVLFDLTGQVLARSASAGVDVPDPAAVWAGLPRGITERWGPSTSSEVGPDGARVAFAVMAGNRHEAILVFGKDTKPEQRDRIAAHHAVTVLGLLLASRRAVVETERRIAGDVVDEACAGRLGGEPLVRRLELLGFSSGFPVTAILVEPEALLDDHAMEDLEWSVDASLGRRCSRVRTAVVGGRAVAVVSSDDVAAMARALAADLDASSRDGSGPSVRVGVGETVGAAALRQSYLTAQFALRAAPSDRTVVGPTDLGPYGLLLATQSHPALEGYVRLVLGPLIDRDIKRSSELVASVRTFVESGGRWEAGADKLGVHRHTLRYRVRKAEELLGRDLSRAEDRMEVWLALKAHEILESQRPAPPHD